MSKLKKLNLGCGNDIRSGWINLDRFKLQGVDIVHDINNIPLPFNDEEFDIILCQDILEHIAEYHILLKELHRILKPSGIIDIRVPHFSSTSSYIDPTHKKFFSIRTFSFFVKNNDRDYYFDFHFNKINYALLFNKTCSSWIKIIEKWVNHSYKNQITYEDTGLRNIFPASNLYIQIIK